MTAAVAILSDAAAAAAAGAVGSGWIIAGFALLAAALVLGFAELFVPTAGLLAVATGACAIASVVCFFMHGMAWGFAALLAYSAGAPIAVMLGLRIWTHSPVARRMALGEGSEIRGDTAEAPEVAVGDEGIAATPLRPVGFVRVGERRVEATAEFGMIEAGTHVTVTEASPSGVKVRARG
jgi:membrane-bound ClpP family serine protease